jgi:hypothetical protein
VVCEENDPRNRFGLRHDWPRASVVKRAISSLVPELAFDVSDDLVVLLVKSDPFADVRGIGHGVV